MDPRPTTPGGSAAGRTQVLVIDDDEKLNALLAEYLARFGFVVTAVTHPEAGLRTLRASAPFPPLPSGLGESVRVDVPLKYDF